MIGWINISPNTVSNEIKMVSKGYRNAFLAFV